MQEKYYVLACGSPLWNVSEPGKLPHTPFTVFCIGYNHTASDPLSDLLKIKQELAFKGQYSWAVTYSGSQLCLANAQTMIESRLHQLYRLCNNLYRYG